MEEEGELEGVERSGPAEKCPHPQATLFHLRDSWSKHVIEAPCPKLRPEARQAKGKQRRLEVPGSQKAPNLMLPGLESPPNTWEVHFKFYHFFALLKVKDSLGQKHGCQWKSQLIVDLPLTI